MSTLLTPTRPLTGGRPLTAREREIIEDITRREFIIGGTALAALITAGCGSDDTPAATVDGSELVTWSQGPFGDVDVPRNPQRVIVGNSIDADFALVLGLPLVGVPGTLGNAALPFAEYHADLLEGVERVQTGGEPNLEQMLALRPDVILDSWDTERARYDSFSQVAPTVNFAPVLYPDDSARSDWRAAITALGALFGRQDEASSAIADYERVIEQGRKRLDSIAGATFAPVNALGADGAAIIDKGQLIAQVASDLGLTPHPLVATTPASRTVLSLEELGRLDDVDYLLFARYPSNDSTTRETVYAGPVLNSPIWQQLPAVVEGRQVDYPAELYYPSPITAVRLAEHLVAALTVTIG